VRGFQRGRRGAGAAERTEQVGREDLRPELVGQPIELRRRDRLRRRRRAGIVGEEVEPAEHLDRVAHHLFGGVGLRHVTGRADHREALRAQPLDGGGAARIVRQMIECHFGAAPGKQLDGREPDARRRPGHQCGLAVQIGHEIPRLTISLAGDIPG
jgi:hypothetical protein